MDASVRAFHHGLYEENLEEASFLYTQCNALRKNPQISWRALGDFEERLDAHLDALVVGSDLALETCQARLEEGDAGELFACVAVFCRLRRAPLLSAVFKTSALSEPPKSRAVADALRLELPDEWTQFVQQALSRADTKLAPVLAIVSGYRRMPVSDLLLRLLTNPDIDPAPVSGALARVAGQNALQPLQQLLGHPVPDVRRDTLHALLAIDAPNVLSQANDCSARGAWAHVPTALGGDRTSASAIRQAIEAGQCTNDSLLALGFLGELASVRLLCKQLADEQRAPFAAMALQWMTGAGLYDEEFVPEPVDEDSLFPREGAAYRDKGTPPKRGDGKPFGTTVRRLSHDAERWNRWLTENASRFQPGVRYRRGVPCDAAALFADLMDEGSPGILRQWTAQELAIRYRCEVRLESDMPVRQQLPALDAISRWVQTEGARFQRGRWYLAGRLQE